MVLIRIYYVAVKTCYIVCIKVCIVVLILRLTLWGVYDKKTL